MATSAFQTAVNTKFNGSTSNAVVLKTSGGTTTFIATDKHTASDIALLDNLITAFGGVAPFSGASSGYQTMSFNGTVVGANATGLQNVSAATAGLATINVGGAKTGASATGLSALVGTAGLQSIFLSPSKQGTDATGLVATSGTQDVNVGGTRLATDATNLVGATTYTATITVDGSAKAISILGSTAATYTTLLSALNTQLAGAGTAALTNGNIRITSASKGTLSTVAITAGTLFAAPLNGFVSVSTAVAGTDTVYTGSIVVDGVTKSLSISAAAAQTYATLITAINTALGGAGTAAMTGGEIKVTSATQGSSSKVSIATTGTLLTALAGFVEVLPAQNGTGLSRKYSATVVVDGVKTSVVVSGNTNQTYTALLATINAALGSAATAALSGGNVVITSATTGSNSSVVVYDTGLFSLLTNFVGITSTASTAPRTYTATVTIDGVAKPVAIQGSNAQTFTALITALNTAIGAAGTAAINGGDIRITSASTGTASTVRITDGDLFRSLTGRFGVNTPRDGASDLLSVLQRERMPNGTSYANFFKIESVGTKPVVPPYCPKTTAFIYHNGTAWKYLVDDTSV